MEYLYEYNADKPNYRYFKHKKTPLSALHFHSSYEMIFVKSGKMLANINEIEYEILAGEGCFIDRFRPHSYSTESSETEIFVFVGEREFFSETLFTLGGIPSPKFSFSKFQLLENLASFYNVQNEECIKDVIFKSAVSLLLAEIAFENQIIQSSADDFSKTVLAALEYIEKAYTEEISLRTISEKFGYSPQHFSRLWHKYLQPSLIEYINTVRISHAKRLIFSGHSVTEAAFSCGFQSLNSFYRTYKKVYNGAPLSRNAKK